MAGLMFDDSRSARQAMVPGLDTSLTRTSFELPCFGTGSPSNGTFNPPKIDEDEELHACVERSEDIKEHMTLQAKIMMRFERRLLALEHGNDGTKQAETWLRSPAFLELLSQKVLEEVERRTEAAHAGCALGSVAGATPASPQGGASASLTAGLRALESSVAALIDDQACHTRTMREELRGVEKRLTQHVAGARVPDNGSGYASELRVLGELKALEKRLTGLVEASDAELEQRLLAKLESEPRFTQATLSAVRPDAPAIVTIEEDPKCHEPPASLESKVMIPPTSATPKAADDNGKEDVTSDRPQRDPYREVKEDGTADEGCCVDEVRYLQGEPIEFDHRMRNECVSHLGEDAKSVPAPTESTTLHGGPIVEPHDIRLDDLDMSSVHSVVSDVTALLEEERTSSEAPTNLANQENSGQDLALESPRATPQADETISNGCGSPGTSRSSVTLCSPHVTTQPEPDETVSNGCAASPTTSRSSAPLTASDSVQSVSSETLLGCSRGLELAVHDEQGGAVAVPRVQRSLSSPTSARRGSAVRQDPVAMRYSPHDRRHFKASPAAALSETKRRAKTRDSEIVHGGDAMRELEIMNANVQDAATKAQLGTDPLRHEGAEADGSRGAGRSGDVIERAGVNSLHGLPHVRIGNTASPMVTVAPRDGEALGAVPSHEAVAGFGLAIGFVRPGVDGSRLSPGDSESACSKRKENSGPETAISRDADEAYGASRQSVADFGLGSATDTHACEAPLSPVDSENACSKPAENTGLQSSSLTSPSANTPGHANDSKYSEESSDRHCAPCINLKDCHACDIRGTPCADMFGAPSNASSRSCSRSGSVTDSAVSPAESRIVKGPRSRDLALLKPDVSDRGLEVASAVSSTAGMTTARSNHNCLCPPSPCDLGSVASDDSCEVTSNVSSASHLVTCRDPQPSQHPPFNRAFGDAVGHHGAVGSRAAGGSEAVAAGGSDNCLTTVLSTCVTLTSPASPASPAATARASLDASLAPVAPLASTAPPPSRGPTPLASLASALAAAQPSAVTPSTSDSSAPATAEAAEASAPVSAAAAEVSAPASAAAAEAPARMTAQGQSGADSGSGASEPVKAPAADSPARAPAPAATVGQSGVDSGSGASEPVKAPAGAVSPAPATAIASASASDVDNPWALWDSLLADLAGSDGERAQGGEPEEDEDNDSDLELLLP